MLCRDAQLQISGLPDLHHPNLAETTTPELSAHLVSCTTCRAYLANLRRLETTIRETPIFTGNPERKQSFLASLEALPPIIVLQQRSPYTSSFSGTFTSPRSVFSRITAAKSFWAYASGVAAVLILGTVVLLGNPRTTTQNEVVALRYELLTKEIAKLSKLSTTTNTAKRIEIWTEFLEDIHREAKALANAGDTVDPQFLSRMYDRAAREGLIHQANQLPHHWTPAQRNETLAQAEQTLARIEADAINAARQAPPTSSQALQSIATTAKETRDRIQAVIRGEGI